MNNVTPRSSAIIAAPGGETEPTPALEIVDELGTHAVNHLNRSYYLLAELEPERDGRSARVPSDRWYRTYAQLGQIPTSPGTVYLLSAACLLDEVHVLSSRSENLVRHARRTAVREQVAHELDAATPWTTQLLDRACSTSDMNIAQQPGQHGEQQGPAATTLVDSRSSERVVELLDTEPVLERLVPAAVAGDERAKAQLLAELQPLVQRFCRGKLGRTEDVIGSADDVAQDVCLAVTSALPHYKIKGLSFRAFVYGIAARKVTDAFRAIGRNRAEPVAELPNSPILNDGPEQRLLAAELGERLGHLLHRLTPRQRDVLVLRIAVGLSAEETAQALGSTPGAVRVTQTRALNRLRGVFSGPIDLDPGDPDDRHEDNRGAATG